MPGGSTDAGDERCGALVDEHAPGEDGILLRDVDGRRAGVGADFSAGDGGTRIARAFLEEEEWTMGA